MPAELMYGAYYAKDFINSYLKSVWTDESMQHNSYRHLGFFSSKHLSGVFYTSKKTGEKLKSTTYNFGVDLIWVRYWISFVIASDYKYVTPKKNNKKKYILDIYND